MQSLPVQLLRQESMPEGTDREGESPAALELDRLVVERHPSGTRDDRIWSGHVLLRDSQRHTVSAWSDSFQIPPSSTGAS